MKLSILTTVALSFFAFNLFAIDISGEWNGTRYQYNDTKTGYIAEFTYKYNLKQEGSQVTGTAFIQSQGGKYAEIAVRGFVEGNQFYFEEYEVLKATRDENFLWCLKKGVLTIEEQDGKIEIKGATASFMELYGFECSGGVTSLSKENPALTEKEVKEITDKENSSPISVYPNPFIESTQISFYNDKTQPVYVDVVDIQGRIIKVIENSTLTEGNKNYTFVPKSDETATYYYLRIKLGDNMTTKSIQKITGLGNNR
ncbi:MAG: T9SS type A sorting domain-containing protein [Chitinophagales bacterium]|nr:T9SS type A sorting domain-containing protein [Chitinophagales bacterium]